MRLEIERELTPIPTPDGGLIHVVTNCLVRYGDRTEWVSIFDKEKWDSIRPLIENATDITEIHESEKQRRKKHD